MKLLRASTIALLLLALQNSFALDMVEKQECSLVPHVAYQSGLQTTAVGLLSDATTGANAKIFWAFFDVSGAVRASGTIATSPSTVNGFVWSGEAQAAGASLPNVDGFALFCLDSNNDTMITNADGDHLGANAWYVDINTADVAYTPVLSLDDSDLIQPDPAQWATAWPFNNTLDTNTDLDAGDTLSVQIGLSNGVNNPDDTKIYIWSNRNDLGTTQTMTIFSNAGTNKTVQVLTPSPYLNIIDVEAINGVGNDPAFNNGSGFITWLVPPGFTGEAFGYSTIKSLGLGSVQTIIGITD